jgi:LDH2 family malate/lactate/ureidoglycolate dehydrogenase
MPVKISDATLLIKSSALSAMIELLAGPLMDDMLSMESLAFDGGTEAAPCHGELITIPDPVTFLGGPWRPARF